jgi:hypothetical protein
VPTDPRNQADPHFPERTLLAGRGYSLLRPYYAGFLEANGGWCPSRSSKPVGRAIPGRRVRFPSASAIGPDQVSETPWTKTLWIYDLRTNQHFTLRTNPLRRQDLDDFVACYNPENRHQRQESERFRPFDYDALVKRDKASLDIFWLRDESLENSENLAAPEVIAAEIVEDLQAALDQFAEIANDLSGSDGKAGLVEDAQT